MSEQELWNELGNLYFLSGSYEQAANAYQRSIHLDTGFGRPYSNLALTYVQQGKFDDAVELYRRSIELLTENKEKAVSWNRLGTVYRHLKDYSKAVIAFQEADELDPESAADFPAITGSRHDAPPAPSSVLDESPTVLAVVEPEPSSVTDESPAILAVAEPEPSSVLGESPTVLAVVEPEPSSLSDESLAVLAVVDPEPSSVLDESPAILAVAEPEPEPESRPEIEWWDIDERRVEAATHASAAEDRTDDPTESWTPSDSSQYQQDLSQMPETISLTTWGDADVEDEFEVLSPLDPEPAFDLPNLNDELSAWLPIPEEEPWNDDRLQVPPFFEDIVPEPPDPEPDWRKLLGFQVVETTDCEPDLAVDNAAPVAMGLAGGERSEAVAQRSSGTQQAWEPQDVDVIVDQRPAHEYDLSTPELSELEAEPEPIVYQLPTEPLIHQLEPEPAALAVTEVDAPPEASATKREEEEMREIELGIEKFKRVVQVNPRNAHAWDALGTLYKSAGLYRDAILAYQQAISNDPSRSLYYHHLGLVYACEGRDEDAIGAFQRVIEIDPDYSLAHATLGGYYRKMGLEELAQKHIGKAMKNIFDSENEYNRACLEAICGNADQAIELLGVALKNKQTYVDWILRDPDLDFIRQDPRFKQLISDYTR